MVLVECGHEKSDRLSNPSPKECVSPRTDQPSRKRQRPEIVGPEVYALADPTSLGRVAGSDDFAEGPDELGVSRGFPPIVADRSADQSVDHNNAANPPRRSDCGAISDTGPAGPPCFVLAGVVGLGPERLVPPYVTPDPATPRVEYKATQPGPPCVFSG